MQCRFFFLCPQAWQGLVKKFVSKQTLFLKAAFYYTRKLKNKSFLSKQIFITISKMKKFLFIMMVSLLHCKAWHVCVGKSGSERIKK